MHNNIPNAGKEAFFLSIGSTSHDREDIEPYFAESFTFRVLEPAAAVELKASAR